LIRSASSYSKEHGRLEERKIFAVSTNNSKLNFFGLQQIAILERKRTVLQTGKETCEQVVLITDLDIEKLNVEEYLASKQTYWNIENKLHRKDFVFNEDRSTIRTVNGCTNMSTLRSFAVSFLQVNNITNVKRCVDNIRYSSASQFHAELFG
jgi:hypothetical protein